MDNLGKTVFQLALPRFETPVVEIWKELSVFLCENRMLPVNFEVSQIAGHPREIHSEEYLRLNSSEIEDLIVRRDLTGFWVDSRKNFSYVLERWRGFGGGSVLYCIPDRGAKGPRDWGLLIERLMSKWVAIGGWQWRSAYSAWQGASELHKFYTSFYGELPPGIIRSVEDVQNGLGPGREFIDTSRFPGRTKQILPTVSFHPSAEMWLGPDFWQYAKCTKEEVLAADFFLEKRDTPHFLYLKSWPEPFSRPDGEQGRQQQRLWKLFFHEDCEWPPGSGGICDEPMYGPPELMPGYKEDQE